MVELGFPGGSDSRESVCNADAASIPESESSPWEGIGYPRQDSLASLLAQMVESPPAMQETRAQFLGQEDPLERGMATQSQLVILVILPGESHRQSLAFYSPSGRRVGACDWANNTFTFMTELCEGPSEDIS